MQLAPLILTAAILSGCSHKASERPQQSSPPEEEGKVTYFDRNGDGYIDREIHDFGCCDRNWALVDSDFNGRYDVRILWGFAVQRSTVDIIVPKRASISKSDVPDWASEIR